MSNEKLAMKKYILLFIIFSLFPIPCSLLFAESEFSLRLGTALKAPVAASQLSPGMGANATLDWSFWNFVPNFDLGANIGGAFASIPVQVGGPLTLFEGKAGPFVRWRPFDRWAFMAGFNGGVYQHSRGEDSDTRGLFGGALGALFHLSPYFSLFAEGGFTYRTFADKPLNTVDVALGIRLNLSEIMSRRTRVQVEKTEQYRVFPVSWAWYENNPIAAVTITNEEPNTITDVNLTFFIESYMSEPWTFANVPLLSSGESIEVPVTALFNEALLNLNETVSANGTIQMQYRSLGARKETVSAVQMPIFRRNILSWDDDRRAAAFVSPRDSSARLFARYVAAAIEAAPQQSSVPPNVRYAIALFEALRLYRISYIIDPSSSYIALSDDESSTDSLNYPYQTLYYRGGDCDDLSILFCSLLETLNIESAFITIPGHIYIAFDIGNTTWQPNNRNIIELESSDARRRRWLPLEITVPAEGFTRAWTIGASQWQNNKTDVTLYPIRECWEIYPSVTVPGSGDNPPEIPEWDAIIQALNSELQKINR